MIFERQIRHYLKAFNEATLRACDTVTPLIKFSLKTPTSNLSRSRVIYQFQCLCGKRYVGRTEQRLADRVKQHIPSIIWNNNSARKRPAPESQSSAIAKHLCESDACADKYSQNWFTILDTARSTFHLSTLEATYISTTNPVLCRQKSFVYALRVCKGL